LAQRKVTRPTKSAPKATPPPKSQPNVVRAEDDDFDLGDLIIGICALVGLPVVTLVVLSFLGMPFGGSAEMNSQQADEYRGLDSIVPTMTEDEALIILTRVKFWVDDRAKDYMKRSRGTGDNAIKRYWQEVAKGVLGKAEADLKRVQSDFRNNPSADAGILDSAQQFLSQIDILQVQIQQEDPFRQVR